MPHEVVHTSTFHFPSRFRSECIQAAMQTSLCSTFLGTKHSLHKLHYNHLYEPHDFCSCMLSAIVLAAGRFNVQNSTGAAEQQKILHTDPASAFRIEQGQCFFPGLRWLQHPNVSFQGALTSTEGWCCAMVLGKLKCFPSSAGNTIRTKMSSPKPWLFDRSFKNMFFYNHSAAFLLNLRPYFLQPKTNWPNKRTNINCRFRQVSGPHPDLNANNFGEWLALFERHQLVLDRNSFSKRGSSKKNAHVYHCLSISWTNLAGASSGVYCDFGDGEETFRRGSRYGWRKAIWVELKANRQFICLQM